MRALIQRARALIPDDIRICSGRMGDCFTSVHGLKPLAHVKIKSDGIT